ncbi:MAG TPA: hypothetical protein VGQ19_13995 [Burkholderiales bacterium]|jgi:hypothetical protein|nr:hypothetical protein [Burkholderiales bacterium]
MSVEAATVRAGGKEWVGLAVLAPESVADSAISASIIRESSDQDQVQRLKAAGYAKLADMVIAEAGAAAP